MPNDCLSEEELRRLEILSELYPTVSSVCKELIYLKAVLNLPKGTEHFISDLHGEYDTFFHILNNCSGVIREKAEYLFADRLTLQEISDLCTLIYYPEAKLKQAEENGLTDGERLRILMQLTELANYLASKHTRTKVQACLPDGYAFIIDELMHAAKDETGDQKKYHEQLYRSVLDIDATADLIEAYAGMIKKLAVDHLHILGDIFDRGPRADKILETLLTQSSIDIEWGNHDILWMGAACGNDACIATVIYLALRYNTYSVLENGYGISLRNLITFAEKAYPAPTALESAKKAMAVLCAKAEGRLLARRSEYGLQNRRFLEQIDYATYTLRYAGRDYPLSKADFATVDPADPYAFTEEEARILRHLKRDFLQSNTLKRHIDFLYRSGSAYKIYNGNLLYHGCIPLNDEGEFAEVEWQGKVYKGKSLLDFCEKCARTAYAAKEEWCVDFMWYLWCGILSPFSGRAMKLFEHIFLPPETGIEERNAYYTHLAGERVADAILQEFGLSPAVAHIINGHTPIHAAEGESPVKAQGKVLVIDGGFCKAYHPKTGIAGYTLIYNSHRIRLKAHRPFRGLEDAVAKNSDIASDSETVEEFPFRRLVRETDKGRKLEERIADLSLLLSCYRQGKIKQK